MQTSISKILGAVAVAASIAISGCDDKPNLYVYTWADYIDPDLISTFEKENGCNVKISTFDSNETMLAKLVAGNSGYDIIMPTEYFIPALLKADLIDVLDINKLPNACKSFDKMFASQYTFKHDLQYAFSCTGILWRRDKVPEGMEFTDWNDLFDKRLGGRVCMMNDIREIIGLALKMNGFSVNSTNEHEIEKAVATAREWKSRCAKMDNESYRSAIPAAEFYAAMSYNSDAIQLLAEDREHIGYIVPTNGTTSSVDVFCILKKSKSKDLAHKFIDMFYSLSNAVKNAEYNGVPMPIVGLYDALSDEYKSIPLMRVTEDLKSRCEDIQDVGEHLELYTKAWDKIKSK